MYRQTAADLSNARERRVDAQLAAYLNQLLGRAHNLVYSGARPKSRGIVAVLHAQRSRRSSAQTWRYTAAATAIFVLGAIAGSALALADPGFQRFILGGAMMDTIERREMWTHGILAVKPLASSAITTNNLSVSFAAFALGITAGIGTAWLMLLNGVLIGTIGVACFRAGLSVSLWSFVAPHGSLELPAIFIAGGAGLILGRAAARPGHCCRGARRSRRPAAVRSGCSSASSRCSSIAGAIEGFVSPVPIARRDEFVIGGAMFTLLCLYLLGGPARCETRRLQQPPLLDLQIAVDEAAGQVLPATPRAPSRRADEGRAAAPRGARASPAPTSPETSPAADAGAASASATTSGWRITAKNDDVRRRHSQRVLDHVRYARGLSHVRQPDDQRSAASAQRESTPRPRAVIGFNRIGADDRQRFDDLAQVARRLAPGATRCCSRRP